MIVLLCGYMGSGKDTFYCDVRDGTWASRWTFSSLVPPPWLSLDWTRMAFADELKRTTLAKYGLPWDIAKTDPLPWDGTRTYRDLLIEEAEAAAPDHFGRVLVEARTAAHVMITDWRRPVELATLRSAFPEEPIVTVRVRRPEVPVPTHPSEHHLDDVTTDYEISSFFPKKANGMKKRN